MLDDIFTIFHKLHLLSLSMNADKFVEFLDDPRVEVKLNNIFKSLLVTITKELTKPLEVKIDELSTLVKHLQSDVALRDSRIDNLAIENRKLRGELHSALSEVDAMEQYCRRDNLVITSIQCTVAEVTAATDDAAADNRESTAKKVVQLCNDTLGLNITEQDVSTAHPLRFGRRPGSKPLILVRFTRRATRDEVYYTRSKLKMHNVGKEATDRIFINEDLTDVNRRLFGAAKHELKRKCIKGLWTANCHIKIRCLDDNIHIIKSAADLAARIASHSAPHFEL